MIDGLILGRVRWDSRWRPVENLLLNGSLITARSFYVTNWPRSSVSCTEITDRIGKPLTKGEVVEVVETLWKKNKCNRLLLLKKDI
jgi:hypothetical protein